MRCGRRLPGRGEQMRKAFRRWFPAVPAPAETVRRGDLRPRIAASMCLRCGRRWLAGRSIWHPWCVVQLRHAFDLYFERLGDGP